MILKYYVTSDIHGYFTYLKEALTRKGFFEDREESKVVVCGDMLDRGSEANELIAFMLDLAKQDRLIYIQGNHEDLFFHCLQRIANGGVAEIACGLSPHYYNGTWDTMLQISAMDANTACRYPDELVRRIYDSSYYNELLPLCVDYFETRRHICTHGWIPCNMEGEILNPEYSYDPFWRGGNEEAWHRARWLNGMDVACNHGVIEPGKTIVCGHWNASYGHSVINGNGEVFGKSAINTPFYADGIIALDACTPKSNMVNCIVIRN